MLLLQAQWLLAQGYARYARESIEANSAAHDGVLAAAWARRMSPFSYERRALYSWALVPTNREEALQNYRASLRLARGDPFLWQDFVRFKLYLGQFDGEMTAALQEVQRLMPNDASLHFQNAMLGLLHWDWGSAEIRDLWSRSVHHASKSNPHLLMTLAIQGRREHVLCKEPRFRDLPIRAWCAHALVARETCFQVPVSAVARPWCERLGFVQSEDD